jgi:hypothetical protein
VRKWLLKGESWTSGIIYFFVKFENLKNKSNVMKNGKMDELRPAAQPLPLTTDIGVCPDIGAYTVIGVCPDICVCCDIGAYI